MTRTILLSLAFAVSMFAADVTGKWIGQVPGRDGAARETTFIFKAEGDKVIGSMTGRQGDVPIAEGKVVGDTISFSVESQRGKQTYTGKIAGDEIQFKRESGQGAAREFTAKRVK